MTEALLTIGGKTLRSRLMLGTGECRDAEGMNAALAASGTEARRGMWRSFPREC